MKTIYISAIYASPPNTMGGNTKILLEIINNLCDDYKFVVFTSEPETFKKNIKNIKKIKVVTLPYKYKKFSYKSHLSEILYVYRNLKKYFEKNKISKNDFFYSSSDVAPDVLPVFFLRKKYNFIWIASLYLFIPNPIENLINNYKFPFFKYIIYYIYQKLLALIFINKFDLCLITNSSDTKRFIKSKRKWVLPMYGGVNTEQINEANKTKFKKVYDAVFCSRLHQQKGISQLLTVWSLVIKKIPSAKLAIIGNGEKKFELFLHKKADALQIQNNIEWLGYVNDVSKYKIYLQSKMLVHSSIYDNNGMVAAEALCTGLPVVMNNLNELVFYKVGCIKAIKGSAQDYSSKIIKLLTNESIYKKTKPSRGDIQTLNRLWSWDNRAKLFKVFIEKYSMSKK